jgi:hypothetical protein
MYQYILVCTDMYKHVLVCTGMYCIVLTPNYLWSDEVANHEGKSQHEHFHPITSHLGMFLTINVNFVEVVKRSDNLFQTASRRAAVTSGFPNLLIRSSRRRTCV